MSNVTEKGQKLDYLTYSFLNGEGAWRFRAVSGRDKYFFICQMPVQVALKMVSFSQMKIFKCTLIIIDLKIFEGS